MIKNGDPYEDEVNKSILALSKYLEEKNIFFKEIKSSYQSKLGPMKWLGPTTSSVIKECRGKSICVYPLSFTIDNSETSYELEIENRQLASDSGVKLYEVAKCPNERFAAGILQIINDHSIYTTRETRLEKLQI